MGASQRLFGTRNAKHWLNLNCGGLTCASITWVILLFAQYVGSFVLLKQWDGSVVTISINLAFFNLAIVLALLSHIRTIFTDPGSVPLDAKPLPSDFEDPTITNRICKKCGGAFKPLRAHHCSSCGRCIVKLDHHCPWMANCIGMGNMKHFILFLFYTCFACLQIMVLVALRIYNCVQVGCGFPAQVEDVLLVAVLSVLSFLFGIFTACMLATSLDVVRFDETGIDNLQGHNEHKISKFKEHFREYFGGSDPSFHYTWLLPVPMRHPFSALQLGYTTRTGEEEAERTGLLSADLRGGVLLRPSIKMP